MKTIQVSHLTKQFRIHEKNPGLLGSITSMFSRNYKEIDAVRDINFEIEAGELVGFIGPNGAGKTTTLKCLSGLLYPSDGSVKVLGFTPFDRKPSFQKQFSLVMGQKNQLWWDLPAIETFRLNKEIYEVSDSDYKKRLDALVGMLELGSVLKTQVRKLSLGQRMKCELVAALLHNPKILFLDEPTIGLDVVMQKTMRDFIASYNKEFGATIILTSHYMDDVKELCQRVIVINQGHIVFDGSLSKIIDQYARNKIITVIFDHPVSVKSLATIGEVKELQGVRAQLIVPRKLVAERSIALFQRFSVEDITIEEPPIEAIIRDFFHDQE